MRVTHLLPGTLSAPRSARLAEDGESRRARGSGLPCHRVQRPVVKVLGLFILPFFLLPLRVGATEFTVIAPQAVALQTSFPVKVRVSAVQPLNAYEGILAYPSRLLAVDGFQDAGSVVTVWLEHPTAENGRIRFSGITPGGYAGADGLLFTAMFRAVEEGNGTLSVELPRAYEHSATAEPAKVVSMPARFKVSRAASTTEAIARDTTPPQPFVPQLARSALLHDGKVVLLFFTQDKESAVAYYEICEGLFRRACARGQSPYLLQNQKANELISVRAVDMYDNARAARLSTPKATARYLGLFIFATLGVSVFVACLLRRKSAF